MPTLEQLYLADAGAGLPWQLDPCAPGLQELSAQARGTRPGDPCDPAALAADLDVAAELLADCHFGIATGMVDGRRAIDAVRARAAWCRRHRPSTWGEAIGDLVDRVRVALDDHHVQLTGAPPSQLLAHRGARPARPVDPGELAAHARVRDDCAWVRFARLAGGQVDVDALERVVADASDHFAASRIVVDLRGCPGGDDRYVLRWFADHLPARTELPEASREWRVGERLPNQWNWTVVQAPEVALSDPANQPGSGDVLRIVGFPPMVLDAGDAPWQGRMLVLVDQFTGSSGESSAWMLKHAFGARLVGQATRGMIEYGNLAPYLLPHAGALLVLPTKHNDYGRRVELVGFPVDVDADPCLDAGEVLRRFDEFAG